MQGKLLLCMLLALVLAGCGNKGAGKSVDMDDDGQAGRAEVTIKDPEGPIPEPQLPSDLATTAAASRASSSQTEDGSTKAVPYTVVCVIRESSGRAQGAEVSSGDSSGVPSDASGDGYPAGGEALSGNDGEAGQSRNALEDAEKDAVEDVAGIIPAFEKISLLHRLADQPPESRTGLEQRLSVALDEAREVMKSLGYYSGRVRGSIRQAEGDGADGKSVALQVRIVFTPGQRYTMGKTVIFGGVASEAPEGADPLPLSLADAGLAEGAPAVATDVLSAVDNVKRLFQENGYPYARIANTRYIVDHEKRVLEAEVRVTPGAFVRMGAIERHGADSVKDNYISNLRRWRVGRPWRQSRVEAYQEALRQSGLFQSIVVAPGEEEDADGTRRVVTQLESAPERTFGGALKYHSDFGPGLQGFWEHRNLTGNGDRFRVDMPLWLDMQEVTFNYRLPFFLKQNQNFIAKGGFINQDTDAYQMTSGAVAAGIEKRFSRYWSGSLMGSAEGGTIKEPNEKRRDYMLFGVPFALIYDSTKSLLNASQGQRLMLSATPYTGEYEGNFNILRSRFEGQAFFPLLGEDKLVLALRGVIGMISGEDAPKVPPSVRFYSGGGGSVRGYEYQSLGPRNSDKDPLGGAGLAEVSAEARWKFTPEWGLVAFVDGGTAFEKSPGQSSSFLNEEMRWGAGLGLRYYTSIGPVRIDVATPLNPRKDDESVQFYISIGQSF